MSTPILLDDSQRAVLGLGAEESAAVIGAPGSGKTTTLIEFVADRIERLGWSSDAVLALTTSRIPATRLRDQLALRLARPTTGPLARTVNSLAFEIVGHHAREEGRPVPRLITGSEQDADIAGLLAGHVEDGNGPQWPTELGPEVRALRGFRTELRELMMRATEYGITAEELDALGLEHDRPEWRAAASFIAEYARVLGLSRPDQLDSAELVATAAAIVRSGDAGGVVAALRLVVVDDFHDATESVLSLLRALAGRGVTVVAFGDPDVAANAFRGGEPDALGRLSTALAIDTVATLTLDTIHRHGSALRDLVRRISERIGTAAAGTQRRARSANGDIEERPVVVIQAPSPAREAAAIAGVLRERHLRDGVDWGDMAVVLRSGSSVPGLARALALAEVPTTTSAAARALKDDAAVQALLRVVSVGMGRTPLDHEIAEEMLLGPFGGLDRLTLRRLRLALRAEELAGDSRRSADELIVEALGAPGRLATIDHRIARQAARLAGTLAGVEAAASENASIEELLWLVWERSGLAAEWHRQALAGSASSAEANRNLDGVVALFSSAKRFVERQPGSPASLFLDQLLDAEIAEDTLSPQSRGDAVLVTTPSGVVGREFDTVTVAGLQEGSWPDMRIRGSLLGPQELVRVATGIDPETLDERRLVRDDELRMFTLAVSRAARRVILSAVANDDESPSVLFNFVPPGVEPEETAARVPLTLRGFTARLRRELLRAAGRSEVAPETFHAATTLAVLASHDVPGARPQQWHGLLAPSTEQALFSEEERIPISPSRLAAFEESPVDWFIDTVSGGSSSTAMGLGTIVHWAMETAADPSVDTVWAAVESRWDELVFEAPWVAQQQKEASRILAAGVAEYLGDFQRDGKELIGAESRFTLEVGRASVNGSIDRVERDREGNVVIVDLKTGSPETNKAVIAAHPQLGAYQLAYSEGVLDAALEASGDHRSGGAKLLFVRQGVGGKSYREGVQAPLSEEELEGFRERIRQAAIGMAAAHFSGAITLDRWTGGFGVAGRKLHRVKAVSSD